MAMLRRGSSSCVAIMEESPLAWEDVKLGVENVEEPTEPQVEETKTEE